MKQYKTLSEEKPCFSSSPLHCWAGASNQTDKKQIKREKQKFINMYCASTWENPLMTQKGTQNLGLIQHVNKE